MRPAARWIFVLLPCLPGLTLLLAAAFVGALGRQEPGTAVRLWVLLASGGAVLLAGLLVGAFVAWRIAHPRPEPDIEKEE